MQNGKYLISLGVACPSWVLAHKTVAGIYYNARTVSKQS